MGKQWSGRKAAHRGQSAVELALLLPILVIFVLGAVDFSQVLSVQQRLDHAAHLATVRLLTDPTLRSSLATYVQAESGLSPVTATASYTVGSDGADQVIVTAAYSYPLLTPGLRNLQTHAITDGHLHLSVTAAGIAATSAPSAPSDVGGVVGVAAPNDATTPPGLSLTCTLFRDGMAASPSKPCAVATWTFTPGGTHTYTATTVQMNGVTSPPSTPTTGP
jgi:Flp pilus assembly protein TadG